MTEPVVVIKTDRRGLRRQQLKDSVGEFLLGGCLLPAGVFWLFNTGDLYGSAVGDAVPWRPLALLWVVGLVVASATMIIGRYFARRVVAVPSMVLLAWLLLFYASVLIPQRSGQAAVTCGLCIASSAWLILRAGRWV